MQKNQEISQSQIGFSRPGILRRIEFAACGVTFIIVAILSITFDCVAKGFAIAARMIRRGM